MRKLEDYKLPSSWRIPRITMKRWRILLSALIEELCHTKGTWAGKKFELIDWQEQIIRDLFGVLKPNGYRQLYGRKG